MQALLLLADNFNNIGVHLNHRDVTLVAISRAPLAKIERFRKRMGWGFKWVSSFKNNFNYDYHVSFTPEEIRDGTGFYNYSKMNPGDTDREGISVFYKDKSGAVFHTYSCYARGIDMLNGTYHFLDLIPKGRDDDGLESRRPGFATTIDTRTGNPDQPKNPEKQAQNRAKTARNHHFPSCRLYKDGKGVTPSNRIFQRGKNDRS